MSKKRRMERLEKKTAPREPDAIVVVYTEMPQRPKDADGRVVICIPDNGRGDLTTDRRKVS